MDGDVIMALATFGGTMVGSMGISYLLLKERLGDGAAAKALAQDAVEKVGTLRDETVKGLRDKLEHHISTDLSQSILTEVKHLSNQNLVIGAKIDKFVADVASLQAQRAGDRSYIENIDTSLQRHKDTKHA